MPMGGHAMDGYLNHLFYPALRANFAPAGKKGKPTRCLAPNAPHPTLRAAVSSAERRASKAASRRWFSARLPTLMRKVCGKP